MYLDLKAIERLRFLLLLRKEMEARFCQIVERERERERVWEVGLSFECKHRGFQFNHFFLGGKGEEVENFENYKC